MKLKKENGITLTYNNDMIITDIDIEPGVTTVELPGNIGTKSAYINFKDSKKVFNDVEEVVYDNIRWPYIIPNSMFPNAKNDMMTKDAMFTNVFFSSKDSVINLKKCVRILGGAFSGCKTINIINTENILTCDIGAFNESALMEQPFINGAKIVGTILYDVDYNCDEVFIPAYVTCIANDVDVSKIKSINFGSLNVITRLRRFLFELNADVVKLNDSITDYDIIHENFDSIIRNKTIKSCRELILSKNITSYKMIDGIMYDKSGKSLIMCPNKKEGDVIIPEGVELLNESAFNDCENIESVTFPDSLVCICDITHTISGCCFRNCSNLKRVMFNTSSTYITTLTNHPLFSKCDSLEEIIVPESVKIIGKQVFMGACSVKRMTLPIGLSIIDDNAFYGMTGLDEIHIPNSVSIIGDKSLCGIKNIRANQFINGLIKNSTKDTIYFNPNRDILMSENPPINDLIHHYLVTFNINNKKIYLPYYLSDKSAESIENILKVKGLTDESIQSIYKNYVYETPDDIKNIVLVLMYIVSNDENIKNIIRRRSKKIASTLIYYRYEHLLFELLRYDLFTNAALMILKKESSQSNMLQIKTIVLNKLNVECNKGSSFSL